MNLTNDIKGTDMASRDMERGEIPLYVKVPARTQDYLNAIKDETGITKTDAVTLLLEIAAKFITPEKLSNLFDDYMLLGRDGLELSGICPE